MRKPVTIWLDSLHIHWLKYFANNNCNKTTNFGKFRSFCTVKDLCEKQFGKLEKKDNSIIFCLIQKNSCNCENSQTITRGKFLANISRVCEIWTLPGVSLHSQPETKNVSLEGSCFVSIIPEKSSEFSQTIILFYLATKQY